MKRKLFHSLAKSVVSFFVFNFPIPCKKCGKFFGPIFLLHAKSVQQVKTWREYSLGCGCALAWIHIHVKSPC